MTAFESVPRERWAMPLSPRLQGLEPNAILAVVTESRRLQARGRKIVDLSLGEPDFPTPAHVGEAAARAVAEGRTRYTQAAGLPQLRAALCRRLDDEGIPYLTREVAITCGASGALSCALAALLAPGDEVLVPVPFYTAYLSQVSLAGGAPVLIPCGAGGGYKLTPAALRAGLTPRSRVLLLNNPGNPTGAVYSREELSALAEVVLQAGLVVLSDEVYADLVYAPASFLSLAALGADLRERTLVVRSLSKTYAMTGWRIGYAAGPEALVEAITRVQETTLVAPSSVSQWAALAAVTGPQEPALEMHRALGARHRRVQDRLAGIAGVRCAPSAGALFVFPELDLEDTGAFCRRALLEHGVALVPGAAFGAPGSVRISFAGPSEDLEEGLDRFTAALGAARAGGGDAAAATGASTGGAA